MTKALTRNLTTAIARADTLDLTASRRNLLLAPLFAALPLLLTARPAAAIDASETQVTQAGQFKWQPWEAGPPHAAEMAVLFGDPNKPGLYALAMKWYPGFMSAPHMYDTDRLCFVLSGTWWVNSGANFDPAGTVPVPAGGFVRRVAHTPHYDGVRGGEKEPVTIAIFGEAPINLKLVEPNKPQWRAV